MQLNLPSRALSCLGSEISQTKLGLAVSSPRPTPNGNLSMLPRENVKGSRADFCYNYIVTLKMLLLHADVANLCLRCSCRQCRLCAYALEYPLVRPSLAFLPTKATQSSCKQTDRWSFAKPLYTKIWHQIMGFSRKALRSEGNCIV